MCVCLRCGLDEERNFTYKNIIQRDRKVQASCIIRQILTDGSEAWCMTQNQQQQLLWIFERNIYSVAYLIPFRKNKIVAEK